MPLRRRTVTRCLLLAFATAVASGCASVLNGRRQDVYLKSVPTHATYTIFDLSTGDRIEQGLTPARVKLRRKAGYMKGRRYRVVFESPGLEPRWTDLESRVSGIYVTGNLIVGGIIGWLIADPLTGGMWSLAPDEVNMDLEASQ